MALPFATRVGYSMTLYSQDYLRRLASMLALENVAGTLANQCRAHGCDAA